MKRMLVISLLLALFAADAAAQKYDNDPAVRKGVLENGLTYYICYNYSLKDRADFYLVTSVGSLQETSEKAGITHLLEHLSFSGTTNFPGDAIETYCRTKGVHYGKDLNASTGLERTLHEIKNVPIEAPFAIDSCLQILHDWAKEVRISQEGLDKERQVILQERILRQDASQRLDSLSAEFLYGNLPYGGNHIIGTPETLGSITLDDVKDFYEKWYRPDNQAIVVVGDFELNPMERKIQKYFKSLEKPSEPLVKETRRLHDFEKPAVKVITDPELINTDADIRWRYDCIKPADLFTFEGQKRKVLEFLVYKELGERVDELFALETMPFAETGLGRQSYGRTQEDIILNVSMGTEKVREVFTSVMDEMERLRRHGITEQELNDVKTVFLDTYEKAARTADHRSGWSVASDCIANFLYGDPYFSPSAELKINKDIFKSITAESVNEVAAEILSERKPAIVISVPEKEADKVPSEQELVSIYNKAPQSELPPVAVEVIPDKLMPAPEMPAKSVVYETSGMNSTTELTLANGLKVILWQTGNGSRTFNLDMFKKGGRSRVPAEELPDFERNVSKFYFENSGVASYTSSVLKKKFKNRTLSVSPYVYDLSHGVSARADLESVEEMFQLVNLYWTSPRFEQAPLDKTKDILRPVAVNNESSSDYRVSKARTSTFYSDTSRVMHLTESLVDNVDLERMERNYRMLFDGARGAVAVIIGDFKWTETRNLIDRYLATIPGGSVSELKDNGNGYSQGRVKRQFVMDMDTGNSKVAHRIHMEIPEYSYETLVGLKFTEYILNKRLDDTIRERQQGTYSISVNSALSVDPTPTASVSISFDCPPSMVYFLSKVTNKEVQVLAQYGPTLEELEMAKKYLEKDLDDSAVTVDFWMNILRENYLFNVNNHSGYKFALMQMTAEEVAGQIMKICSSPNYAEMIIHSSAK